MEERTWKFKSETGYEKLREKLRMDVQIGCCCPACGGECYCLRALETVKDARNGGIEGEALVIPDTADLISKLLGRFEGEVGGERMQ